MIYDGTGTAKSVLEWLKEGGYSCVLEYNEPKKKTYLDDEDDDEARAPITLRVVRDLISDGDIMPWRMMGEGWVTYRPTEWVREWYEQHPPKDGDDSVPQEARDYLAALEAGMPPISPAYGRTIEVEGVGAVSYMAHADPSAQPFIEDAVAAVARKMRDEVVEERSMLGHNLTAARELAGLSIGQAAVLMEMAKRRIIAIEDDRDGTTLPTADELAKMCDVYRITEEGARNGHRWWEMRPQMNAALDAGDLDQEDRVRVMRLLSFKRVGDTAETPTWDVWASFRETPISDGLDSERDARVLVLALNHWDSSVGGEFAAWYTPHGLDEPKNYASD